MEDKDMKLKELFINFEKAEALTESIDIDTNEDAWDKANESEYNAFFELASEIMNLIKCDRKTANAMITHKKEKLRALVARM
jgi:hypothetical protein